MMEEPQDQLPSNAETPLPQGRRDATSPPVIIVRRAGKEVARLRLDRSPLRVGRLPDNDVVLEDRLVSRQHATIVQEAGRWWIRDAGSRSRLRVAGQACAAHLFADGDRIEVGPFTLVFLQSSQAQEPVAAREVSLPPRAPGSGDDWGAPDEPAAPSIEIPGYAIAREIGRGGMGRVYEAVQLSTRRKVALKVLLEGPFSSAKSKQRFEREVRIVAGLRHPNIAPVYESGLHQGRYWFSMEYVDGRPLYEAAEVEKLTLGQRLAVMAQACEAVGYAHEHKVVHRDLKPGNILLSSDGQPHVLDFGLAKLDDAGPAHEVTLSVAGTLMGTPAYMSPEQTARDPSGVDARSDVYSLGVVLYQLVTGQFPYDVRGRIDEVVHNIATTEPTPPSQVARSIDSELEAIILKALAKDRDERYATATELAEDLRRRIQGEPVEAKLASRTYRFKKSLVRHRLHLVGTGALAAAILASVLVTRSMLSRQRVDDTTPAVGATTPPARADVASRPQAAERQTTTEGAGVSAGNATPPAGDTANPLPATPVETAETNAKALVYQVEAAIQSKSWQAALGYLERLKTGYADTAVVRELGDKPSAWDRQIRDGFATAVVEEAPAPMSAADTAETKAKTLVLQLEGAIQAGSWQTALGHLEQLKSEHADTGAVRALGEKLTQWERQIHEALRAAAAADEREARDRLSKLATLLDREDYLRAQLLLESLRERFGQTAVVKQATSKIDAYAARIVAKIKKRDVQTKNQYLFDANPPDSTQWQKALQDARPIASQYKQVKRLFLARVLLEDEEAEPTFWVEGHGIEPLACCWGYGGSAAAKSGDIIIATTDLNTGGGRDKEFGLAINTLYHYSPTIGLNYDEKQVTKVGETQVVRLGEFVVRSMPPEDTGTLVVKIVPEAGFESAGAQVCVWRGRSGGPNFPVAADNECVVRGIAAGEYQVRCFGCVSSAGSKAVTIRPNETSTALLEAFGQRSVEVEWRFRPTKDTPKWRRGTSTLVTGDQWQIEKDWGIEYVGFQLEAWDGQGFGAFINNARMLRLDASDFATGSAFPPDEEFQRSGRQDSGRLESGSVLALHPSREGWQALVHVRAVKPASPAGKVAPPTGATDSPAPAAPPAKQGKSKKGATPQSQPKPRGP
jgi:serine/threonine protein kinase